MAAETGRGVIFGAHQHAHKFLNHSSIAEWPPECCRLILVGVSNVFDSNSSFLAKTPLEQRWEPMLLYRVEACLAALFLSSVDHWGWEGNHASFTPGS